MKPLAKATTAAAVSTGALFALQTHTDAAIVYSGVQNLQATLVGTSGRPQAVGSMGGNPFTLRVVRNYAGVGSNKFGGYADVIATGFKFLQNSSGPLKKLAAGNVISAGKSPFGSNGGGLQYFFNGAAFAGTWPSAQTGFAGLMLPNGDLGWMRLEWTNTDGNPDPNTVTALDWAYEDSGGPITTAFENAPEPSRALLALAGLGAMALRRRRKKE